MRKALNRALLTLGILTVFAILIVWLVAAGHPLWKEFVGGIAGGVTGVIATVYAASAKDDARKVKHEARAARGDK